MRKSSLLRGEVKSCGVSSMLSSRSGNGYEEEELEVVRTRGDSTMSGEVNEDDCALSSSEISSSKSKAEWKDSQVDSGRCAEVGGSRVREAEVERSLGNDNVIRGTTVLS